MSKLNDTEALTRQGLKTAENQYAADSSIVFGPSATPAKGSADRAVDAKKIKADFNAPWPGLSMAPRSETPRRETGVGGESLSGAMNCLKECK